MTNRRRLYAQGDLPNNESNVHSRSQLLDAERGGKDFQIPTLPEVLKPSETGTNWNEVEQPEEYGQSDANTSDSEINTH